MNPQGRREKEAGRKKKGEGWSESGGLVPAPSSCSLLPLVQQIRGSWSPGSMSTTRVPPMRVLVTT
jgi:hypothetical protein